VLGPFGRIGHWWLSRAGGVGLHASAGLNETTETGFCSLGNRFQADIGGNPDGAGCPQSAQEGPCQAITRRIGAGRPLLLADLREQTNAAPTLRDAGFEVSTTVVDVS
jgi:hypothetical protein